MNDVKTELELQAEASSVIPEPSDFRLGDVDVLPASGKICGPEGERKLDPKVMDVLLCLAAAGGKVVPKEALMSDVWGDIIVTDFALSRCIYQLRKNLGQISAKKEPPIKTLPKRGYCLNYAYRLGDQESPAAAFRLVARLQQNPLFRSQFYGPVPKIPPAGVQLFALWFGFIEDFERERAMLQLQYKMADNARLHRELAWALIGEGDLESARREAWIGLNGMLRNMIVNFQVAYIALQTREGLNEVLDHYQSQWPGLFEDPPELASIPEEIVLGAARQK